ncbi:MULTISPECIES: triose-phosphate isomerase [unclassified Rhizobium]|uniref:triose-phosphate isomerase n=1 Tax=unclassified Rhizobium TaxID=2613769 RepID=UPI001ADA8C9D|nr:MULTISPECIES: triose-phosphate isomerase [unclassified Rhizobium]MBO9100584.1 triose-phosphate isomerase [Rhizobium sp. L58/93]MBO9136054.1 triose-phosphate isomerase [Rhizobium sp. B209b/85]MBO9171365.1 triose-phosphate isomerase [Rhizobium sp. L245/93]MBO9187232.1 triose-phosphate isomerase [Rhizobium sp. E27B/91]QXZ87915.1 triose-phosphate isomerase [Rhizobium sp. K1/93]
MTETPFWIGTSWKMNKTLAEARSFAEGLASAEIVNDPRLQCFVIPPFTSIREVKAMLKDSAVKVGAQNMHWAESGAWTGEISPLMLVDCGMDVVELGHSERREFFGETDETVGLKVEATVRHGMIPLICIGETLADRESGRADEVLAAEVRGALGKLSAEQRTAPLLLAYEPVWAIGENGIPAKADYADARQAEIIKVAEGILGRRVPCLYGGSVNPGNCAELAACDHIDGLFIGRSAWNVTGYLDILARVCAVL